MDLALGDSDSRIIHIPYELRKDFIGEARLNRSTERLVYCKCCNRLRTVPRDNKIKVNVVDSCYVCNSRSNPASVIVVHGQAYSLRDTDTLKSAIDELNETMIAGS